VLVVVCDVKESLERESREKELFGWLQNGTRVVGWFGCCFQKEYYFFSRNSRQWQCGMWLYIRNTTMMMMVSVVEKESKREREEREWGR
jgi:hypothetical protein